MAGFFPELKHEETAARELNAIRQRVTELMARAKHGGLTDEEKAEILRESNALWARLHSANRSRRQEAVHA